MSLLCALFLAGCESAMPVTAGLFIGNIASVTTIGRTLPDAAVSLVTGRDCSLVRLDRGQSYCRAEEPPPVPQPYCTRSIGRVDCWRSPPLAIPPQPGVADGRAVLTAAQEAHRTRRWPGLWSSPPTPVEARAAAPAAATAPVAAPALTAAPPAPAVPPPHAALEPIAAPPPAAP
ncbi:hypothetical protein GCM10011504_42810 [Siccirubricoccus deserti]|nr:hypothetical protein GCM10011504_42810 [Siccirubricoccus deserti]